MFHSYRDNHPLGEDQKQWEKQSDAAIRIFHRVINLMKIIKPESVVQSCRVFT